jgi:hypothetical protein
MSEVFILWERWPLGVKRKEAVGAKKLLNGEVAK